MVVRAAIKYRSLIPNTVIIVFADQVKTCAHSGRPGHNNYVKNKIIIIIFILIILY